MHVERACLEPFSQAAEEHDTHSPTPASPGLARALRLGMAQVRAIEAIVGTAE